MEKVKSDAYAIISLAFAIFNVLGTFDYYFLYARGNINLLNSESEHIISLFLGSIIPIAFGIIGLKSSAKRVAKAGIYISIIELVFKLFYLFIMPIIAIMVGGVV